MKAIIASRELPATIPHHRPVTGADYHDDHGPLGISFASKQGTGDLAEKDNQNPSRVCTPVVVGGLDEEGDCELFMIKKTGQITILLRRPVPHRKL